jgi:hypothetical protein
MSDMPQILSERDQRFIEKRRWLASHWNLVGSVTLAGLMTFVAWMFWAHQRMVNPLQMLTEIEAGQIPLATLEIMAVMLTIMMPAVLILLALVITLGFAVFGIERRYQRIIDELLRKEGDRESRSLQ